MPLPKQFSDFRCEDYPGSEWAATGCWDESSQHMLNLPIAEIRLRDEISFLMIGNAGVDGIEFGYRAGHLGIWGYYPIDAEFVPVAASVAELVESWLSGRLKV